MADHPNSGVLIAFEGIDGAGKTTQAALLTQFLRDAEVEVVTSKEPTDGPWGQKIRSSAANGRLSPAEELEAFIEDRKQHVRELIRPALEAGKAVILDRYFYSTLAYQGRDLADMERLKADMLTIAPAPELVLLLDVPPELGLMRIQHGRGERPNTFESISNLTPVRSRFLQLAGSEPTIRVVDATQSEAAVREAVLKHVVDDALKLKWCAKPWGCDGLQCAYRITKTCPWARIRSLV